MEHINSWRDSGEVFEHQIRLNNYELQSSYPNHWKHFIKSLDFLTLKHNVNRIVDIGCGAGVYSELARRHFPRLSYLGYDYSENALQVAKKSWPDSKFKLGKYQDLSSSDFNEGDVLVANGLLDILPNGDKALERLLSLSCKFVILQRINITEAVSSHNVYRAYDVIETYEYHHNITVFSNLLNQYGYSCKDDEYIDSPNTAINVLIIKND